MNDLKDSVKQWMKEWTSWHSVMTWVNGNLPRRLVFNKACLVLRRWWGRAGGRSAVNSQQRYRASQRPVPSPSHQLTRSLSHPFFALAKVHKISARGIRVIYSNIYRFKLQDSRYEFWFQFQALNKNRFLIPCSNHKRISQTKRKLFIRRCQITRQFLSYNLVKEALQQLRT